MLAVFAFARLLTAIPLTPGWARRDRARADRRARRGAAAGTTPRSSARCCCSGSSPTSSRSRSASSPTCSGGATRRGATRRRRSPPSSAFLTHSPDRGGPMADPAPVFDRRQPRRHRHGRVRRVLPPARDRHPAIMGRGTTTTAPPRPRRACELRAGQHHVRRRDGTPAGRDRRDRGSAVVRVQASRPATTSTGSTRSHRSRATRRSRRRTTRSGARATRSSKTRTATRWGS